MQKLFAALMVHTTRRKKILKHFLIMQTGNWINLIRKQWYKGFYELGYKKPYPWCLRNIPLGDFKKVNYLI